MSDPREHQRQIVDGSRVPAASVDLADVLVASVWWAARLSGRLAGTGARIAAPVLSLVLQPPLVPHRLQPAYMVQLLIERAQRDRPETLRTLGRWSAGAVPGAVDAALDQVDVQQVTTVVLDHVDLTEIVSAVLGRVDVDKVAQQLLNQVDLDKVARQLLNQLDLTQLVLDRVDLQRVVAAALERLDLTGIVVDQVDLGHVVSTALQHVDLTEIVLQNVDLIGVARVCDRGDRPAPDHPRLDRVCCV